jgi:hypothetical protein
MSTLPRAFAWQRLDTVGAEQVSFDDRRGFAARGVQIAVDPVPYSCRYEVVTNERWETVRFDVTAEGAGWLRTVRLERAAGRWRVTTAEQGDLDAALRAAGHPAAPLPGCEDPDRLVDALDVDLTGSPLTNTLPLRRLGLAGAKATVTVAWVVLPGLAVLPADQSYAVDGERVRFSSAGFEADLLVDDESYVVHYPGLARRA